MIEVIKRSAFYVIIFVSSWISDMLAQILSDEIAKDVAGAEAQVARTADLKAEIDAREDRFVNIKCTSELLIKQGHFDKKEVCYVIRDFLYVIRYLVPTNIIY